MKNKRLLFLLFFIQISVIGISQSLVSRNYNVENGLANSTIFRMCQDSKGFIWFSTGYGISRFDGIQFKNYSTEQGLPTNKVLAIREMPNSDIICGSTFGFGLFCIYKGKVFDISTKIPNLPKEILFMEFDKWGRLWIVSSEWKLGYVSKKINKYSYTEQPIFSENDTEYITSLYLDRNKDLYVGASDGLYLVSRDSVIPKYIDTNLTVIGITTSNSGKFYLGSFDKIVVLNNFEKEMEINEHLAAREIGILEVKDDHYLWFYAFPEKMFVYDLHQRKYIDPGKISEVPIYSMLKDNEDNIWLGSVGMGAFCFSTEFAQTYTKEDGLYDNYLLNLSYSENKNLWITTYSGINYIQDVKINSLKERIISSSVWNVVEGRDGKVYLPSNDKINIIYNHEIQETYEVPDRILNLQLVNDTLWLLTRKGVYFLINKQIVAPEILSDIKDSKVFCVTKDSDNTKWIGTNNGVYTLTDSLRPAFLNKKNTNNEVNAIVIQGEKVWIAMEKGLMLVNKNKPNTQIFHLLHNIKISSLALGQDDQLWIGTYKGLFLYEKEKLTKINQLQGIIGDEIRAIVALDSVVWLTSEKGLCRIVPNKLFLDTEKIKPRISISEIIVDGIPHQVNDSLNFDYNSRNIRVEYVGFYYKNPQSISFKYRLNKDSNWNTTNNESVNFNNLPKGSYCFEVIAVSENGMQSPLAKLCFTIKTPWWLQIWFIILVGFFVIVLVLFAFHLRLAHLRKRETENLTNQRKIVNMEFRALTALMNPHFVFNVLNSIQYYMKYVSVDKAGQYLKRFTKLIRIHFENSKQSFNSLADEIKALDLYMQLESFRFDERLNYKLTVDPQINENKIFIPSNIIQPFVENAIWHGLSPITLESKVSVNVFKQENSIFIEITDNGIGINKTMSDKTNHTSSAINISRERLLLLKKLHNNIFDLSIQDISDIDPNDHGTKVIISLPVISNLPSQDWLIRL
ncbi:MAG: histidine kinase [Bacteroidales bacterium]|nr:histidine kinase [Bacteroidales bacterium]